MTVTVTDCENLVIDSDWFSEWWAEYPNNTFTLSLEISVNGGDTTTTTLDETNLLTVDPFSYNLSGTEEGVYSFNLLRTDTATNNVEPDYQCFFNECDLNCELAENLSTGCATTHRLLDFLRALNDCTQCDCTYANIAYAHLTRHKTVSPVNITNDDCNCN